MPQEHESNRQAWNEAAAYYREKLDGEISMLKSGGTTFCAPELKYLTPLRAQMNRCIHLQCAGGSDSLSLINFGAQEVIGLDISDEMIEVARAKTRALGMNARWYRSDLVNAPDELSGSADLLYTGKGALNWMMDIKAWGQVVARLLKPGGVLYLFEGHPITYLFDPKASDLRMEGIYKGYFADTPYASSDWPDTYVGRVKEEQATKYEKAWPVSLVITSLIEAGLVLEKFEEHPDFFWNEFAYLPEDLRRKFPNTYSVLARKPG